MDAILRDEAAASGTLLEADCRNMLTACLEKGNTGLAMSLYQEMCAARRGPAPTAVGAVRWPAANLQTTTAMVLGLCRCALARCWQTIHTWCGTCQR